MLRTPGEEIRRLTEQAVRLSPRFRYGLALAAVAAATILRLLLAPALGAAHPFATFYPAVALSAWIGGIGPGLAATAAGVSIAQARWSGPRLAITAPGQPVAMWLFLATGALVSGLNEAWRRLADRVAQSEDQLRVTLASIGDGVITTDADGCVTHLNPAAQRLTGWSDREAAGHRLEEVFRLLDERTRRRMEIPIEAVLRTGAPAALPSDRLLVSKDGRETPVDDRIAPIIARDGRRVGAAVVFRDVSGRRRAEREAARRDRIARELAAIVESSDDAIFSTDLDGTVTSWNRGAERLFGYTAAHAVGTPIMQIVPDDRRREEQDVLGRIQRGEWVRHFETVRLHKDGTPIPISLAVSPIRAADGSVAGASSIARDVRERQHVQAALADLQRRLLALVAASGSLLKSPRVADVLKAAFELARDLVAADAYAIWHLDPGTDTWRAGAYAGVSETFAARMIAANRAQQSAIPFPDPLVAEDVQAVAELEARRDAYRAEGIVSVLAVPLDRGGRTAGTISWYYRTPHRFTEVEVRTAQALGSLTAAALRTAALYDVEQRNRDQAVFLARAGNALASSLDYQETLRAVANLAVPDIADWCAVDMVSNSGAVERVAVAPADSEAIARAAEIGRYPFDPPSAHGVHEVVRTGRPVMMSSLADAVAAAGPHDGTPLRLVQGLGLASYMCVPMRARGRTIGALTFATAASGRRYTQADLRFAEDVAARAALAVENARVYEEARHANQLKDEFLATLSHELRTPLNAILGYARILRTRSLPGDKLRRAVEVLERNATALTHIVEDVLDISRITRGKTRLTVQPVNVAAVIDQAIATVRPAADARRVRLETSLDRRLPPVSGDPDRLQQIVWNLLSNAVKFTPGGGLVQVGLARRGDSVEISVSDTGRGINPAFLPYVFERFRQADSRFTREHGGLGLGLAIARDLVELHGGTIQAASEGEGKGATFRVLLPVAEAARHPSDMTRRPSSGRAAAPAALTHARLDGVRVLAVDDEQDALALVREILESAGASVLATGSPLEALAALERGAPDVLVADLGMPDIDGFELIRRVRESANPLLRALPAAALTAYARSDDRTLALESGYQLHLAKPIDPDELVAAIAALARAAGASA